MIDFITHLENYKKYNIGSKAHHLFEMKEKGLQVPDLFCINETIFETYRKGHEERLNEICEKIDYHDQLSLEAASLSMKNLMAQIEFDYEFKDTILNYSKDKFKEGTVFSVRSSCALEDGGSSSFAGQFDTYLNVTVETIFDSITKCLCSLYSANVLKYCQDQGISPKDLKMSVILQEMINSEASGIAFTVNPRGLLNEMVIVVGKGTGNLVVEDKVPVTTYYYNTTDQVYYYETQENSYQLDQTMVSELIEVIQPVKEIYGECLDIEFALFQKTIYLLQVRPITTLTQAQPIIFDNSNIVESYPNITLPLTATFVKEAYYGVFHGLAKRVLANGVLVKQYDHVLREMVDNVNGRMYYNISNWYTVIKFLPFSKKIIPVWQEMLGVTNKQYNEEKIKIGNLQKVKTYVSILTQFISVPRKMEQLNRKYEKVSLHFRTNYKKDMKNEDLINLYHAISNQVLKDWDITLLNDLYAFVYVGAIKSQLKKMNRKDHEARANQYISGITNMESVKPMKALLQLAQQAVDEGRIDELKKITSNQELWEYLSDNSSEFTKLLENYIENYGDRSLEELKLESKTFRVSPILLLTKLVEYTEDVEKLQGMLKSIQGNESQGLSKELFDHCSFIKKKFLRQCSKRATLGIRNREISRLNRSRIYGMVRTIFLTIGQNLSQAKFINQAEDIFYLTTSEVFDFVAGKGYDLNGIVKQRRTEYAMFEKLPHTSRMIFMKEVFQKKHANINSESVLEGKSEMIGIPCSNGIVSAQVVVVEDPKDIKEFKDKILVTRMTDPGWVFLITMSKGIIAEQGSLLSHTAIISRELHIPSIVGVKNITKMLRTGDIITMNGNTGEIIVNKRELESQIT